MTYARDTFVIESIKVAWTEGRSNGFVPWSFFVKDESANKGEEKVLFYQPFGFQPPSWRAIDEHPFPEATFCDYCDAIFMEGRFRHYRSPEMPAEKNWAETMARAVRLLGDAGLEGNVDFSFYDFPPPANLKLVPDWTSFISHDEHLSLIEKEKWASVKAFLEHTVKERCAACASGTKLFGDGYRYFHRKDFAFVRCPAEKEHDELETEAWAMYANSTRENYRLLRGHMDRYNRLNSSRKLIRSHSAFRKLVDMGPEAVPFILHDLRNGRVGGIWSAEVLAELTGRRGGDPQWWLTWAKSENYEVSHDA